MRPGDPVDIHIVIRMPRLFRAAVPLACHISEVVVKLFLWLSCAAFAVVLFELFYHGIYIHEPALPRIVAIDCSGTSSSRYHGTSPLGLQQYDQLDSSTGVFSGDCLLRGLAACTNHHICQQISHCIDRDHHSHFRNLYPDSSAWPIRRKVPRPEPY